MQDKPRQPRLAVDCIVLVDGKALVIQRKYTPLGWALPGGFVESGESVEAAVRREVKEETELDLENLRQFRVYSAPGRDPRGHVVSVVFTARGIGKPRAGDDADRYRLIDLDAITETELVFDHAEILRDFRESGARSMPGQKDMTDSAEESDRVPAPSVVAIPRR
ncbi:MAG TPA: NUDIX hydrolase [bacterium]|nr:NUDIX hydrolase [bacterium]